MRKPRSRTPNKRLLQESDDDRNIPLLLDFGFVQFLPPELDNSLTHEEIKEANVGAKGTANQNIPDPQHVAASWSAQVKGEETTETVLHTA